MTTTLDALLLSAVDLARSAVLEIAPSADRVGEHEESVADGERVVTHYFTCLDRGYRGWRWAATVSRTPDSTDVTVAEVVLLPGSDALLAPAWVPWDQRVRPGDLGPGDLHPAPLDDPRLEPGFTGADALEPVDENTGPSPLRPEQWELGLGRETVLSPYGRGIAADRWYDGDFGPDSPMAKAAPAHCASCGFLLPIGGQLGQVFGACANPLGADGRIVALGYGCGAHSSVKPLDGTGVPVTGIAVDDGEVEVVDLAALPAPRPVVDDVVDELDVLDVIAEPVAASDDDGGEPAADVEVEAVSDDPAFLDADDDRPRPEQLAIVVDEIVEVDVIGVEIIEGEVLGLHADDESDDDEDDDEDDSDEDDSDADDEDDSDDELDDVVDVEPDEVL